MDKKKALEHVKELLKAARDNPKAIEELEKKVNWKDYGKKAALVTAGWAAGVGDANLAPKYKEAASSAKESVKGAIHSGASKVAEATKPEEKKPEVKKEEVMAKECSYQKMSKEEIKEDLKKEYKPRFKKEKVAKEEMDKAAPAPAPAPSPAPSNKPSQSVKPVMQLPKKKQPVQLFASSEDKKVEKSEGDSKKAKVSELKASQADTDNSKEVKKSELEKAQPVKGKAKRDAQGKAIFDRMGANSKTSEGVNQIRPALDQIKAMVKPDPLAIKSPSNAVTFHQGFKASGQPNEPIATISMNNKVPRLAMPAAAAAVQDKDYAQAKSIISNRLGPDRIAYFKGKLKR